MLCGVVQGDVPGCSTFVRDTNRLVPWHGRRVHSSGSFHSSGSHNFGFHHDGDHFFHRHDRFFFGFGYPFYGYPYYYYPDDYGYYGYSGAPYSDQYWSDLTAAVQRNLHETVTIMERLME
jgi:hypothetical protein